MAGASWSARASVALSLAAGALLLAGALTPPAAPPQPAEMAQPTETSKPAQPAAAEPAAGVALEAVALPPPPRPVASSAPAQPPAQPAAAESRAAPPEARDLAPLPAPTAPARRPRTVQALAPEPAPQPEPEPAPAPQPEPAARAEPPAPQSVERAAPRRPLRPPSPADAPEESPSRPATRPVPEAAPAASPAQDPMPPAAAPAPVVRVDAAADADRRQGGVLLRLLEHGSGPGVEIAWPRGAAARAGLYRHMRRCLDLRPAVMAGDGRLYVDDAAGGASGPAGGWRPDRDRYSGFVRQPRGYLAGPERTLLAALRGRHRLGRDARVVRLFPRAVDAALLGGLSRLIGADYKSAGRITGRYRLQGGRLAIEGLRVDGRPVAGTIRLHGRC